MREEVSMRIEELPDYWTCPRCGANLDNGEHCDCKEREDFKDDGDDN